MPLGFALSRGIARHHHKLAWLTQHRCVKPCFVTTHVPLAENFPSCQVNLQSTPTEVMARLQMITNSLLNDVFPVYRPPIQNHTPRSRGRVTLARESVQGRRSGPEGDKPFTLAPLKPCYCTISHTIADRRHGRLSIYEIGTVFE